MNLLIETAAAVAAGTVLATAALAQSTVVPIDNEAAPRLIVEPPLPGPLAQGVVFIPYRVENLRILPVGGAAARNVSPRVVRGRGVGTVLRNPAGDLLMKVEMTLSDNSNLSAELWRTR